jgi:hypothetical protein
MRILIYEYRRIIELYIKTSNYDEENFHPYYVVCRH